MTNIENGSPGKSYEMDQYVGDEYTPLDQLVSPVGPSQFVMPFTSVDSNGQEADEQENIHLFGQSQFHDNLGPVYAVPTFPVQHGIERGTSQLQENLTHPRLFDESQFHNNLGPVYAGPTYPWPQGNNYDQPIHGNNQSSGRGQWQQWEIHPHVMVFPLYCCGWHPMGHYYCQ